MSALPVEPIILREYDPAWPAAFEEEKARLEAAIREWAVAIEHVGSTAVPGLAAKPVIDIGVALHRSEDALLCITPMVALGYRCMGEFGIPGRIFFRKLTDSPAPGQTLNGVARTHQVHMYERGHWENVAHILFRDYLRVHPATAREYEGLKRELAGRHAGDVEAYAEAKSAFVRSVLSRARREAKAPITIADYDPSWPARYEEEKGRLLGLIGGGVLAIEHVGSTAVPGLAAKPIIDIMPGVRSLEDAESCIEGMRRLGYEYVPEFEDALPGRRYFRKGHPVQKLHVHIVEVDGAFWRRHISFRDYLRSHPGAAEQYAALKRRLAAKYPLDSLAYTEAKSKFIQVALGVARGGRRGPVEIMDYDARWPAVYEAERTRILNAAGRSLVDVQHVGSTAVPGLAAKPIIDITAGVQNLDDAKDFIKPLVAIGYDYVPEYGAVLPERRFFRRRHVERGSRGFHLHVVELGNTFWRRHIAFRDYLRTHTETAQEYADLKRRLALKHGDDHDAYTEAKSEFILGIEKAAAAARSPSSRLPERGDSAKRSQ